MAEATRTFSTRTHGDFYLFDGEVLASLHIGDDLDESDNPLGNLEEAVSQQIAEEVSVGCADSSG